VSLPDLQEYVGGDFGPFLGWDAVNAPMIRHWCEAMGDSLPLYSDEGAAVEAGFGGIVAPPTMLMAWTMVGYGGERPPGSGEGSAMAVMSVLQEAGYNAVVATNCEQEYTRYLEEGDRIYARSTCESISEEKTTALGVGFFVTELSTFYDQHDAPVGTQRFRVFLYRPHATES